MSWQIPNAPEDNRPADVKAELEYGTNTSTEYKHVSQHPQGIPYEVPIDEEPEYFVLIMTFLSYLILNIIGHIRDFFGKLFKPKEYSHLIEADGYAPWHDGFESFYERRLKARLEDCFARPIHGAPGRYIHCFDRDLISNKWLHYLGTSSECLNLSSYNYLGFGQSKGPCTDIAKKTLDEYGTSACSPQHLCGTTDLHKQCEAVVADFVGQEDAILVSQGYGTNGFVFECIVDKKTLIISDQLNHASSRFGIRVSGSQVRISKHNDTVALEETVRDAIAQGQPRTHRPWNKIIIAIEGMYSMEGSMCDLPEIVRIKEKYNCYLYVDEAHSIGALGPRGRGVCDYFGVDPKRIDVLMGTFTKSFGAAGGYIAGSKSLMDRIRLDYATNVYGESMPPPVLAQIVSSVRIIKGELNPGEGQDRLHRLAFYSRYLRLGLKRLGFILYGSDDSPVIPLLLYTPGKMAAISRMLYKEKIAIVLTAYPATSITTARVRICLSSSLTKEDLDYVLRKFNDVGDQLFLKYSSNPHEDIEDVLRDNVERTLGAK